MAINITVSEEIAASVEDVFNYTQDANNLASWQADLVDSYSDAAEPGLGTVSTQVRKIAGIKVESQMECTEFNPPYNVTYQVIKGPVPFTVYQTYEDTGGGTLLTISVEGEVVGPLKVVGENRVANQTEASLINDLATLKSIMEG